MKDPCDKNSYDEGSEAAEPPENGRMRFCICDMYGGALYVPENSYTLRVTEYADVCEGETLTARSVECPDAAAVISKAILPFKNRTVAMVEQQLRVQFASLDAFTDYCDENSITYVEQPLWIDTHSFHEYTGEHRGEFAPFANKSRK